MYSISDLERISGIKAHTIRIWEKRYEILHPDRTPGNHRLYTDQDLLKLLSVEQLISEGYKISNVAEWHGDKIKKRLRHLYLSKRDGNSDVAYYNNRWLQSALEYNEDNFHKIYQQLRSEMSFMALWEHYLVPALQHMGQLWLVEEIAPAEEHFFSQLLRRKILIEFDTLRVPDNPGNPVLLFLPPGEYHELGLLVSDFMLRSYGVFTINLGSNVPVRNIEKVLNYHDIFHLVTFIQNIKMNRQFLDFIIGLEKKGKEVFLNGTLNEDDENALSGYSHIRQPQHIDQFEKYIIENPKWAS